MKDGFVLLSKALAPLSQMGADRGRVTFLINSMEGGGAERAMANLLHYLLPQLAGQDVELVLLDDLPQVQHLPAELRVVTLDGGGGMLRSARALTRHFRGRPTRVCVSYLARANCLNVWLSALFGHRAIISERVQTSAHLAKARRAWLFRLITRFTYPRAAAVVAVSQGVAADLAENFAVPMERLAVIGNPIDASILARRAQEAPAIALPARYILAVGRLVPNKNFAMLIAAYARTRPEAELVILGEGPERPALMAQIAEAGIADRVHMPGFVANPYPVMARAEYLVSCSNAEGFPNTLIEAMTLGCAVVATDCPSGPAEVLRGSTGSATAAPQTAADGILLPCEDVAALAAVMKDLESPARRADLAARALARSRDFGVEDIVRRYLNVIQDTARPLREERRLEG